MQAEGFNLEAIACLLGGRPPARPRSRPRTWPRAAASREAAARHAAIAMREVAALFDRALAR